ncbi:MAG: glycosyltransferase [Burkholderiaceae bacterium]|nr:glycosyltransferase [Burkholderiaceae bacterium]
MCSARLIVYSSLFPSAGAPNAGGFIRERMFRVAKRVPLVVVAPQPWSPLDWLVRMVRKSFRPQAVLSETMDGVEVHRPRFLSVPGVLKRFDGWLMAMSTVRYVARLQRRFGATLLDAHFLYPDGYAATLIGARLGLPVTITIRGSKDQRLIGTDREALLRAAAQRSARLIAVTRSLATDVGAALGQPPSRIEVIGNGVDLARFARKDRAAARARLGIDEHAKVVIGVGNLIELKGFHRVIPLLPRLRLRYPNLVYLIVGGASSQGDLSERLRDLAREHAVADCVRLVGAQPQEELAWFYSAADVFALATEYEGWANVFLEAMACGLPVVSTRVGGNAEVVREPDTGVLVDYWDPGAFADALEQRLDRPGDPEAMIAYAAGNSWDSRIERLVDLFENVSRPRAAPAPGVAAS